MKNKKKNKKNKKLKNNNLKNNMINETYEEYSERMKKILSQEFEKELENKKRRKKRREHGKINRDKYAQLNVKFTQRVREANDEKFLNRIRGIKNKFGEGKVKNTYGGWKEGQVKINTTRSKWEKNHEEEEARVFKFEESRVYRFDSTKENKKCGEIIKNDCTVILIDVDARMGEFYTGKLKLNPAHVEENFYIRNNYTHEFVEVIIKKFLQNHSRKKFTVNDVKITGKELCELNKEEGIPIYEIVEIVEREEEEEGDF